MKFNLVGCEETLLREIGDHQFARDDIAVTYAYALVSGEEVDWTKVNTAIMRRWSPSGLVYIKTQAWKRVREREASDEAR